MVGLLSRSSILLLAGLVFAITALLAGDPMHRLVALGVALALALSALWLWIYGRLELRRARRRVEDIMVFIDHDAAPAFCTDDQGGIIIQNKAAAKRFNAAKGDPLSRVLEPLFANPDAVVHRLRNGVVSDGAAREDVVTRRGHVRVSVSAIPGGELWRIEDMVDRPQRTGDGLALPMLTTSASGTILFMNESLRQALGRRAKHLDDVFEDLPLRNGGIHQLRTREANVSVRVAMSRPVADRKEIFIVPVEEAADRVLPGGVDALLDALPIALLQIDRNGIVTSLNRAALKLLPCGAEGPVPLASLVEGLGRSVGEWVADGIEGRGLYRPEVVQVSGAGESYLQITLGRPLSEGQEGLIAVLNDATELKSIEAQFVQSQKMQAIGQLAGGVAHDFNNLLTAISGHCDLLLLRRTEEDPDYADLNQIHQNANRAAALVGQLLAFSRKQTLKMEDLNLRDTLGEMTHLLNRLLGERVRLVVAHDPALVSIRGDRRQLEQVLMNLVVNARDAMPDGGEVRIDTECRYLETGLTRDQVTIPPGQYVIVRVADQGSGIDPTKIGRIFEPFFSTKRPGEGTGLGLSMAYGIVKQSGGYIFADSDPGKGAVFSLYFPAGRTHARTESAPDTAARDADFRRPDWVDDERPAASASFDGGPEGAEPAIAEVESLSRESDPMPEGSGATDAAPHDSVNRVNLDRDGEDLEFQESQPPSDPELAGQETQPSVSVARDGRDGDTPGEMSDLVQVADESLTRENDENTETNSESAPADLDDSLLTDAVAQAMADVEVIASDHPDGEDTGPAEMPVVADPNVLQSDGDPVGWADDMPAADLSDAVETPSEEPEEVSAQPGQAVECDEAEAPSAAIGGGETADAAMPGVPASDDTRNTDEGADEITAEALNVFADKEISEDAAVPPVPPDVVAHVQPRAQTVLLVEDEAPVRAFASRALRLKGYTVVEAACAEDALTTLDDDDLQVDLFVTDVMMPGLDGPSWVRKALKERPEVRTIFVSGYTQNSMTETSDPVPNSYFLPKPFSLADLTRTVQRALQ